MGTETDWEANDGKKVTLADMNIWVEEVDYDTTAERDAASASYGSSELFKQCNVVETGYKYYWNGAAWVRFPSIGGSGAPVDASYVTINAEGGLSAETQHASIAEGFKHTPKAHLLGGHTADTIANLNTIVSDATLADKTLTTRGDILYHDAAGLQRLAAGTNGFFLKAQGAGADPVWSAALGGGDMLAANYDAAASGTKVDTALNAEKLNGQLAAFYAVAGHKDDHKTAGSDAFLVTDLLDSIARVGVRHNSAGATSQRRRINLIDDPVGTTTWTVTDDAGNEEIDISITAPAGNTYKLAPSYTIYKTGADYYAMNADGDITYGGPSDNGGADGALFSAVMNAVFLALDGVGGGLVRLKTGTYVLDALISIYDNTTLEGSGWATILQYPAAPVVVQFGHSFIQNKDLGTGTQNSNITIRDLQIDGNWGGADPAPNPVWSGINMEGVANVQFDHLLIVDTMLHGIRLIGNVANAVTSDVTVSRCYFSGQSQNATMMTGSNIGDLRRCFVVSSYCTDTDSGFVAHRGKEVYFIGCHAWDNYQSYAAYNNNIGMVIETSSEDCAMIGCTYYGDGTDVGGGLEIISSSQRCAIVDSKVSNSKFSISIAGTTQNCIIANNTVYDPVDGRVCFEIDGSYHTVTGNNALGDPAVGAARGFDLACTRSVISNNVATDIGATGVGIRLQNTATNNIVSDNQVIDSDGTHMNTGIQVMNGADDNKIVDNYIYQCNVGIQVDAGATSNIIRSSNRLDSNVTAITDAGTTTIFDQVPVQIFDTSDANAALSNIGDHVTIECTDTNDVTVRFNILVPDTFQQLMRAQLEVVPLGTGNLRRNVATDWGAGGEAYNNGSDSIAASEVAVTTNEVELLDLSAAFTGIVGGDRVGVAFTWEGSHANDTVNANIHIRGFSFDYV